jgi:plastocyanin
VARSRRIALALLPTAAGLAVLPAGVARADATVNATAQNQFDPSGLTVRPGDTVTWRHTGGTAHTVTANSGAWSKDSNLPPTTSTTFTFDAPGRYTYYCRFHGSPTAGMRGVVVVSSPPKPKPTPKPSASSPRPSPRPTSASPRPSASPSPSATRERSPSPSPSRTSGTGTVVRPPLTAGTPTASPRLTPPPPAPTVAPSPDESPSPDTVVIGGPGLTPSPPTDRARGIAVLLAAAAILGVGSAQVRTLTTLPLAPPDDRQH